MIAIRNHLSGPAFVLASIVSSYPDESFVTSVRTLLDDESLAQALGKDAKSKYDDLRARLADILGNCMLLDDLRSEFIDRFDRGKQVTSLYETEYGRERAMVKGNELADIAGFYNAFGFETGGEGVQPEMLDHISVELEFYALLIFKSQALSDAGIQEGLETVLEGRKKFIREHLGRYISALCGRPGVLESSFYNSAFAFCKELIFDECQKLGVELEQIEWLSGQVEGAEMVCGGSVGCLK